MRDQPITEAQREALRRKLRALMATKTMPDAAPQTDLEGRPLAPPRLTESQSA